MLTLLELVLSEDLSPLQVMSFNFVLWNNRQKYIELIQQFLHSKISENEVQKELKQMRNKDLTKSKVYTWEQIGLRIPEDNEEINRQADFSYIINLSRATHGNGEKEDIETDFIKLKSLLENPDQQFYHSSFNPRNLILLNYKYWVAKQEYIKLMTQFTKNKITGVEFESSFFDLVYQEVDIHEGEINFKIPKDHEEVIKQAKFYSMISNLFRECDAFVPDHIYNSFSDEDKADRWDEYDLSEEDLRKCVKKALKPYIY